MINAKGWFPTLLLKSWFIMLLFELQVNKAIFSYFVFFVVSFGHIGGVCVWWWWWGLVKPHRVWERRLKKFTRARKYGREKNRSWHFENLTPSAWLRKPWREKKTTHTKKVLNSISLSSSNYNFLKMKYKEFMFDG